MKRTALAAVTLATLSALAPSVALAMCSDKTHAMSCTEGMVWDEASKSCTKQVSS